MVILSPVTIVKYSVICPMVLSIHGLERIQKFQKGRPKFAQSVTSPKITTHEHPAILFERRLVAIKKQQQEKTWTLPKNLFMLAKCTKFKAGIEAFRDYCQLQISQFSMYQLPRISFLTFNSFNLQLEL